MFNMALFTLANTGICLTLFAFIRIRYNPAADKEKSRAFERGFDPSGGSRLRFCMKFFLIGVIFLIFDVEVRLIMPLPFGQTLILLFIFVLTVGLAYE